MTPDLDIYRAAKLLVDQHGADAPIEAAMRVDELLVLKAADGNARHQSGTYQLGRRGR